MELPESLVRSDEHGCKGYAEWGFMSTTLSKDVALRYSGVHVKGANPMAIAMEASSVDRGACIKPFSQYEGVRIFTLFIKNHFILCRGNWKGQGVFSS